jgi:predicted enzyme related to lactoylglutathione lyase
MSNAHGDFIWYELLTTDADAAEAFYRDVVGWNVGDSGQEGVDYRILSAGNEGVGGLMQLTQGMTDQGARPVWLGYIAVEDVDATVAAILDLGGGVHMPAMDMPDVGRIAMVADPQGVPFYVMRGSSEGSSTAFSPTAPGHCAWNELSTRDVPQALDFYGKLFGWEKGDVMPMGDMGDYQLLEHNGAMIGAMSPYIAEGGSPIWTYYFQTPDIDRAIDRISAGGGQLLHGPHQVPGDDWIIIGNDPQGAMFALVGARPGVEADA